MSLIDEDTDISIPIDVGQTLRLHLANAGFWTVVRGWKPPHIILVDSLQTGDPAKINSGTPCEVRYLREGTFRRFETEILGVLCGSGTREFLGLKYPDSIKSQTLRVHPRIRIKCPASAVGSKGAPWPCEIMDITRGGCRVKISQTTYTSGDEVELSCVPPNQRSLGDVRCVVKRYYQPHMYGLEFRQLDDTNRKCLKEFLMIFTSIQSIGHGSTPRQKMAGDLEEICLPDLLQVLVNSRRSYQLDITRNSERGRLFVKDGGVLYAATSHGLGVGAIFELFSWPKGRYHVQKAEWTPRENIDTRLEYLLL